MATSLYSQEESVLYIGTNGKLTTADHAVSMQKTIVSNKSSMVNTLVLKDTAWIEVSMEQYKLLNDSTYRIKGTGESIPATTIRTFKKTSEGIWEFKDMVKGQVKKKGFCQSVLPLVLHGEVTEYFPNGNKKSVSQYKNNELLQNNNWLENGDKYIDNVFYSVDSEPTFNSGMKVLHQHIKDGFKDAGINISFINGSMTIGFVVMENGRIDGIEIINGLGQNIDESVCHSFTTLQFKGSWTPARLNGQPVRYYQVFPINFKYDANQTRYATVRHDIMELKNKD
jgi:protein TonB